MRAVIVETPGPPAGMRVADVPAPEPGPGEVSIDVAYAGVGFVDTLFRNGTFPLATPFTPGIEVAGHVRELGAGVTGLGSGEAVAAMLNDFGRGALCGGYAAVAVARADLVTAVPPGLDLATAAAALVNGTTAWLAVMDLGRLQSDEDVLVLGASGGLGSITARLSAALGAGRVIGVVGTESKRAAAVAAGCTDVLLASELRDGVQGLTDGRGVDVAVDPVGGHLRAAAFDQLAPLGRLLVVGNASGEDPAFSGDAVWLGTKAVLGLSVGGVAHVVPDRIAAAARSLLHLLGSGTELPPPAVLPLEQAADAHRQLEERRSPSKIVLACG